MVMNDVEIEIYDYVTYMSSIFTQTRLSRPPVLCTKDVLSRFHLSDTSRDVETCHLIPIDEPFSRSLKCEGSK